MKVVEKSIVYIQKHLLRSLCKLDKINKHIDKSTYLSKTELRQLIQDLREPLMRAYGYIFPDEEIKDICPDCGADIVDNSCVKCNFNYNLED